MIQVQINGEARDVDEGCSVTALLARLGVPAVIAVVERNGAVVPKAGFDAERLAPGDRIEIVRLMGGG